VGADTVITFDNVSGSITVLNAHVWDVISAGKSGMIF